MQGKTKTFQIKSLERIISNKIINGVSFLATNPSGKTMWLDLIFVQGIFTSMGMSTKTPFIKLNGSLVEYEELAITDELLTQNNGAVVVTDRNNREITFEKVGNKQYSHRLHTLSAALQTQIDAVAVTFEDDWGTQPVTQVAQPAKATAPAPAAELPPAEDQNTDGAPFGGEEVEANLTEEAGM